MAIKLLLTGFRNLLLMITPDQQLMLNTKLRVFISFLIVCFYSITKGRAQQPVKVYADPETITGIKASKFIEKIDFIALETTKDAKSLNDNWFVVGGDDFIVMDKNAVYFFDKKTGKFLYKSENEKKQYEVQSIQYVPLKKAVLIKSFNKHYTISNTKALQLVKRWKDKDISKYVSLEWIYPQEGFRREKLSVPSIALNQNLTYFDNGFLYRNYSYDKYSEDSILYRIVQYDSNNRIKHRYFPYLNLKGLWSYYAEYALPLPTSSTPNDHSMLFQLDFSPTIYELRPDTLIERYQFVFPMANVMPADFNALRFNSNIDFEKYKEQHATVFSYDFDMIEHGKYLFFGTMTPNYQNRHFLLLNKVLYDMDKMISDSSIYNLPPGLFNSMSRQDKGYMYTEASAATILKYKDSLLKNKELSKTFKDCLSTLTAEDNNIIIRIKLK